MSDNLFFSFESPFIAYEQFLIGHLPRVDLVTQDTSLNKQLRPLEIKLTALPDNSTCNLSADKYGCELVIRPDTIVYLACSIVANFKEQRNLLSDIFNNKYDSLTDWTDGRAVWSYIQPMIADIDKIILSVIDKQEPLVVQPIWKTEGKSPQLTNQCLDVFVWSNFAFTQLFLDVARSDLRENLKITRQIRTIIWLFKMLFDFSKDGQIDHLRIIDELSYNTKNDKAFAVSGKVTHKYMKSDELETPRIHSSKIKEIILWWWHLLLSPERRFDAIIYSSPSLFT